MIGRVLCAVCLLLVAACPAPPPTSLFGSRSGAHGPVDDMLDRRSQAFRAGDEARFLADLDPGRADARPGLIPRVGGYPGWRPKMDGPRRPEGAR